MNASNAELSSLINSIKSNWKDRIIILGIVALFYILDRYVSNGTGAGGLFISIICIIAYISEHKNKTAEALEKIQTIINSKDA